MKVKNVKVFCLRTQFNELIILILKPYGKNPEISHNV